MATRVREAGLSDGMWGVTFDWWGTLYLHRDMTASRVALIRSAAQREGRSVSEDEIRAAYVRGAEEFDREWRAGRAYTPAAWLRMILDDLRLDLAEPDLASLQQAMEEVMLSQPPPMAPGAKEVLLALHAAGIRLGLISDTGLTVGRVMRRILEGDSVLHCFQGLAFSDELGTVKPARLPYETALAGMGVPAARAIHVGDLPFTDICGAKVMGMRAVLITGVSGIADDGNADAVVADFSELRRLLADWGLLGTA